ncbi:MAG: deoxyribose-phosphate aldolase [Thermoprotei archaeon]|nr:MAG: deoxyribose-phosphate aldolase [Thermoprotei archaeon]
MGSKYKLTVDLLARIMDTSLIEPDTTEEEVRKFIEHHKKYPYAAIAVDLYYIPLAVKLLKGTKIDVVAPIAYPTGGIPTDIKVEQAKWAIEQGANELDVAVNMYYFKFGQYDLLKEEIRRIVKIAESENVIVKVIPQTAFLTPEEIKLFTKIAIEAGAHFIKTNSGYGLKTLPEHVKIIKDNYGDKIKVMAAGGVRNAEIALSMLEAGADRIATSTPEDVFNTLEKAWEALSEEKKELLYERVIRLIKEDPKSKLRGE